MAANSKTAYVDFKISVGGSETEIKIFETENAVFVYVNQHPQEMHLYSDPLKAILQRDCKNMGNKEFSVLCNLSKHECLEDIAKEIVTRLSSYTE